MVFRTNRVLSALLISGTYVYFTTSTIITNFFAPRTIANAQSLWQLSANLA